MSLSTYTIEQIADMKQRRISTKSHYKMTCGCCGKTIHRGDEITQMLGCNGQMRGRGVEFTAGAVDAVKGRNTSYGYAPTRNNWVHLTCRPQYFQNWRWSPGYESHPTAYSEHIDSRRHAAAMDPDWGEELSAIPDPDWKWEEERLAAVIIPLQRIVKKKWQKIYQERWKKKVVDAVTLLDKATEEVIYKWQNDVMVRVSFLLGIDFPQKPINPACPPCHEGYRVSWNKMVADAAHTLDYAIRDWEFIWQHDIIRDIRKKYAK